MRKLSMLGIIMCFISLLYSQDIQNQRYIEVSGIAEQEVVPDEIRLIIGLEEYSMQPHTRTTEMVDYTTKMSIDLIEKAFLTDLEILGIKKDKIILNEVGNYRREEGREFLMSKQYELVLSDVKQIDKIISSLKTPGISNMSIKELKNKDIAEYRKQVKIEALKAAQSKAEYLLSSINKQVGDVLSITEISDDNNYWMPQTLVSNSYMGNSGKEGIDNIRKIKLRYEIKVRYEIK